MKLVQFPVILEVFRVSVAGMLCRGFYFCVYGFWGSVAGHLDVGLSISRGWRVRSTPYIYCTHLTSVMFEHCYVSS